VIEADGFLSVGGCVRTVAVDDFRAKLAAGARPCVHHDHRWLERVIQRMREKLKNVLTVECAEDAR